MTFAALAREKEKDMVKIVVDAMGGDNAPEEIVNASGTGKFFRPLHGGRGAHPRRACKDPAR